MPGDHLGTQDDRTLERVARGDEAVAGLRARALAAAGVDADRTGIPGRHRIAAVAALPSPGLVRGGHLAGGLA